LSLAEPAEIAEREGIDSPQREEWNIGGMEKWNDGITCEKTKYGLQVTG